MQTTARTFKHTVGQGHGLPVSTYTACLTCVCRIHCYEYPPSFYRFGGCHSKEVRPRCVIYAFSKAIVVNHPVDVEVFNEDPPVLVNDPSGLLVGEVITLKSDALVNTSNNLATLGSLGSAFIFLGELALRFSKFLLFLFEKAGILNRGFIGEGSKGVKTDIYTDSVVLGRKNLRLDFASKRHVPLARRRAEYSGGLWASIKRAMLNYLDVAYLGNKELSIFNGTAGRDLRKREAVIAELPPEARMARSFTGPASAKEGFESKVDSYADILKHLAVNVFETGAFFLQSWKTGCLIVVANRRLVALPRVLAFGQEVIVEPTAFIKGAFKGFRLLLRRIDAVSVVFKHRNQISLKLFICQHLKWLKRVNDLYLRTETPWIYALSPQ